MKNNYPIKYVVMPIYEQVGWYHALNELERKYDAVAYIVSKCYVISETTNYEMDGSKQKEYQVVFPYEKEEYEVWNRIEPEYHLLNKKCINYTIVNEIYDNYEDALKLAESKNEELLSKEIRRLPFDENFYEKVSELKQKYENKLSIYKNIERQIEKNTPDLKVGELPNEQSLIIIFDEVNKKNNIYKGKMMNISLYDFINLYRYENFEVFNILLEDFELMKQQLEKNKILDELFLKNISKNKLLVNLNESEIIQIIDSDKSCFYLNDNRYLVYQEDMNIYNIEENHIIIYTIETYEDIIKSYIPRFISKNEESIELEGKTIRKKLTLK